MTSIDIEKGATGNGTMRKAIMMTMLMDFKGVKVLIVSTDPFITDFLRGLVGAHGYDNDAVADFHEAVGRLQNGLAHVVFIDDSCLEMENFKNFQMRTQDLIEKGLPVILLTNEQMKQDLERLPKKRFFRIVRKPVDYLQIGQVMVDLMSV
ncbi:MAG: response regulator [Nitrospirota bacterium]|nr:response regulator [Nitrospirota bacterium]MDH4360600.1 response regulator [Nitrospirota bacterium]MDH5574958.1 response regulator [Nitrospirota bacterium]